LLVLGVLTITAPVAAKPPAKKAGTTSVHFRTKGKAAWNLFGVYASQASAKSIREHLIKHGFEVQLRASALPIPKVPPRKPTGMLPTSSTVTYSEAVKVFRLMAGQKDIAFRFPIDGCYARAELMIERLRKKRLHPYRVWSVANGEPLYARTKNNPHGHVTWGYHVAPVLRVRFGKASQRWYVIDPSLFTRPVTIDQWEGAQMRTKKSHKPYITVTRIGEAPVWIDHKRRNGTGYWPGSDPKIGLHAHAVATMKRYKPWEGKDPPPGVAAARPAQRHEWSPGRSAPVLAILPRRLRLAA
jgi:hypothetical protein